MRDLLDVGLAVPTPAQQRRQIGQVGDRVHVGRALLAPERAIQVGPDGTVPRVAGQLANMIDVIGDRFSVTPAPSGCVAPRTHPGTSIQASKAAPMTASRAISSRICSSENWRLCATSVRQFEWLGPDCSVEMIEHIAEAIVAEVCGVENDTELLHFAKQFVAGRAQAS